MEAHFHSDAASRPTAPRRPLVGAIRWDAWVGEIPTLPAEIADHLRHALDWTAAFPESAEADAVLLYAWNESDEGGWLCPTLSEGTDRLDAIRRVLSERQSTTK
jgi:hypothetical protein